ncbi:MAG TPA: 4-hydroxy-tetrahydrodipicolinate synthase [Gemmatimonadaceae bacterium]|nr:4-hydroxy-tetrahydrodipicolinate synthase [Gemmatimonadaceae bacterium]
MTDFSLTPLSGCGTALVTPFTPGGDVDETALRALVEWQLAEGIDFLVPCGSTGEAATLDLQEHLRVVSITAETVAGRVAVIGGAASNDTRKAITLSKQVIEAGATHLLHASPMYSRPPQRGIVAHFQAIADAVTRPVVLYNVPSRTASNMEAATTLALAAHPNIVAMKEASGNIAQIEEIMRNRPDGFSVLSGDDAVTVQLMARGANGVISVVSNAAPRVMSDLTRAMLRGDVNSAHMFDGRLKALYRASMVESNPIPIKAAMHLIGRAANELRLPLVPLAEDHLAALRDALAAAGAIER